MREYSTTIIRASDLGSAERARMANLYLTYYDGSSSEMFEADLNDKTEVLIVNDGDQLVGFTTLKVYLWEFENRVCNIVYSGDTIVTQAHWGQQSLAFSWIEHMGEVKRARPDIPLYWFLIVKGHRTFRYLPAFGKSFYPHWSEVRHDLQRMANQLALEKFGADFNTSTGVVEFPVSRGHLKPEIAEPTEAELGKEPVRYFMQRNPNFRIGHELVCLCELEECNLKPLTRRIFTR